MKFKSKLEELIYNAKSDYNSLPTNFEFPTQLLEFPDKRALPFYNQHGFTERGRLLCKILEENSLQYIFNWLSLDDVRFIIREGIAVLSTTCSCGNQKHPLKKTCGLKSHYDAQKEQSRNRAIETKYRSLLGIKPPVPKYPTSYIVQLPKFDSELIEFCKSSNSQFEFNGNLTGFSIDFIDMLKERNLHKLLDYFRIQQLYKIIVDGPQICDNCDEYLFAHRSKDKCRKIRFRNTISNNATGDVVSFKSPELVLPNSPTIASVEFYEEFKNSKFYTCRYSSKGRWISHFREEYLEFLTRNGVEYLIDLDISILRKYVKENRFELNLCRCGKYIGFHNTWCSNICMSRTPGWDDSRKKTWKQKYGVDNPFLLEENKRKSRVRNGKASSTVEKSFFVDICFTGETQKSIPIGKSFFQVDGIINNTIIEFYGTYWHRHPDIYDAEYSGHGFKSKDKWEADRLRVASSRN